jgi:type III restriction system methylase
MSESKIINASDKLTNSNVESLASVSDSLIKSKERVKEYGEVFTPEHIVKQMCDLCEPNISDITKKIFEPTCGNGNFLVEILKRKLSSIFFKTSIKENKLYVSPDTEFNILIALSNIYAVDIQEDNIKEAKDRLKTVVFDYINSFKPKDDSSTSVSSISNSSISNSSTFLQVMAGILNINIIRGDTLKDKKTLYFYDFIPNKEDKTFEVIKYSLHEIEKIASNTKLIKLDTFQEDLSSLKYPPKHSKSTTKTRKVKAVPSIQGELFLN